MKKLIQCIKEYICKKKGCIEFEELYAVKSHLRYNIIERHECSRCGKSRIKVLDSNLSRVDILKKEWFSVDNDKYNYIHE